MTHKQLRKQYLKDSQFRRHWWSRPDRVRTIGWQGWLEDLRSQIGRELEQYSSREKKP